MNKDNNNTTSSPTERKGRILTKLLSIAPRGYDVAFSRYRCRGNNQFYRGLFFSLVALLCFFSSIKKNHNKKKIKKLKNSGQRRGQKSVCAPLLPNSPLLIVPGVVLLPSPPPSSPTIFHQTQKWGSRGVCRFVKRWNQVFAQFVRPSLSGTATS